MEWDLPEPQKVLYYLSKTWISTNPTYPLKVTQMSSVWAHFWAYEGDLGSLWGHFGHMTVALGHFEATRDHFGVTFGA